MALSPDLHVRGQAAQVLAFRADVAGDPVPGAIRRAGMPGGGSTPGRTLHAQVRLGGGRPMLPDFPEGVAGDAPAGLPVGPSRPGEQAAGAFGRRVAGGAAIAPSRGPAFFIPGAVGMLKDRFGTHGILMAEAGQGVA
jgi:uncharacterized glyoxalase superfamily protein PhnB